MEQVTKVNTKNWKASLNSKKSSKVNRMSLAITCHLTMLNMSKHHHKKPEHLTNKSWATIAFNRNKNIHELTSGYNILNENILKDQINKEEGYYVLLICKRHYAAFKLLIQSHSSVNRFKRFIVYFMDCTKWKIQYVCRAETMFNIRVNNTRDITESPKAIPAFSHLRNMGIISWST